MSSIQLGAINFLTLAGQTRGRWRGGVGGRRKGTAAQEGRNCGTKKGGDSIHFYSVGGLLTSC